VTAYNRTDDKQIATGALESIDNEVDTTTGTVKTRVNFPNADLSLFPNQFVNSGCCCGLFTA
jgi:membrane fusion protein, multidrug efflux system